MTYLWGLISSNDKRQLPNDCQMNDKSYLTGGPPEHDGLSPTAKSYSRMVISENRTEAFDESVDEVELKLELELEQMPRCVSLDLQLDVKLSRRFLTFRIPARFVAESVDSTGTGLKHMV